MTLNTSVIRNDLEQMAIATVHLFTLTESTQAMLSHYFKLFVPFASKHLLNI
jgi:hypothetical protein